MKRSHRTFTVWNAAVTMLLVILVLTTATYAWFTMNRTVSTDRASARSGTDTLELQISEKGGDAFRGTEEAPILQINKTDFTKLMPVSTADLQHFVYNSVTNESDQAEIFGAVEEEKYFYHGRFYIRALADGKAAGTKMALYLDETEESGGGIAQAEDGQLLNAARLGLTFNGENPVIYYLSERNNEEEQQIRNTVVNGVLLGDDQVLKSDGKNVEGVNDPAVSVSANRITMDDTRVVLPQKPLFYMELNQIYTVDVYFYIEGCDPDCSNYISYNEADLHLAFYGILEE